MDMTSDLSLQESCMTALRHMGVEVRALIDKTNELETENAKLRNLLQQNYEFIVHLNETEAYPSSDDLDMQRWLLLNEVGIEVDE